jgi:hypothetical protein
LERDWALRRDRLGGVWGYTRATAGTGCLYLPGIGLYEFVAGSGRVTAVPERQATEASVVDAYYRHALPIALDFHGFQVLHASAARGEQGVHIFCGASHAGKSTLAYALRRRRYEIWGDDAVAIEAERSTFSAVPLPFALRLRDDVAAFFDGAGLVESDNGRVAALYYNPSEPRPVASVSLLERGSPRIGALTASESLPALLANGFYFAPEDKETSTRASAAFLGLIAATPAFRVSLPRELGRLDAFLDELEERVLGGPPA